MAFPGFKKREDEPAAAGQDQPGAALAQGPTDQNADQLKQLTEQLNHLGQLLRQANEQVLAYLVHRESQAGDAVVEAGAADALTKKLDALAEKLDQLGSHSSAAPASTTAPPDQQVAAAHENQVLATLGHLGEGINSHHQSVVGMLEQVQQWVQGTEQRIESGLQAIADQLRPAEPDEADAGPAFSGDWQRALLGSELAEHPRIATHRKQLLQGALSGDPAACTFLGQLMVFRSAPTDKMPQLLKELGEAYYRWQPKRLAGAAVNPVEQALAAWVKETLQDAGIGNTIELVHPGERFDAMRHSAATRGVEIAEVLGWIVLRDNGKVYTKAAVAVR